MRPLQNTLSEHPFCLVLIRGQWLKGADAYNLIIK